MTKHYSADHSRRAMLALGGAMLLGAAQWPATARAQTDSKKIPIATIGAGHVGSTIGGLWVRDGHKVFFSSRHPEELKDLVAKLGPLAQAGTVEQALAFGNVVLMTVPYGALPQIGRDYAAQLKGKIVLDTCNATPTRDGAIADEVEANGIGVTSQKYLPGTRSLQCRLPAMMRRRSRWRRDSLETPASIRSSSASSPMRSCSSAALSATGSRSAPPN
jgi:8-hydroxy-5-deazaflavin:NADPH oxidoreductase